MLKIGAALIMTPI